MKKVIILLIISFTSCISTSKTQFISRAEITELHKTQKKAFSKILLQWKNYSYSDYHKINTLEKDQSELKAVEVDQKDYRNLKDMIIAAFRENGLYDEINGSGSVKILLLTYGRWTYSELITTYFTDTPYIFILPSSTGVTYRMIVKTQQDGNEMKFENEGYIKTTFFLPLFPLYPLMTFKGAEKTTLKNLINKTIIDIVSANKNK